MDARKRIIAIRLMEKVRKHPEYSKRVGVHVRFQSVARGAATRIEVGCNE